MPRVGDSAHMRLDGSHVDHRSPLEDQVQAVYRMARKYAEANGFVSQVLQTTGGPRKGVSGPMVMKTLIHQVFPQATTDEFNTTYGLVSQVLKKTNAAVCIHHPIKRSETPTWFISDTMPDNLVIVAISMARNSAGQRPPSTFDEDAFLTKRERYRVTPEEAGETLIPGEVTVRSAQPGAPATEQPPAEVEEVKAIQRERNREFLQRVLDELTTTPVPLTVLELQAVVNRDTGWDLDQSSYRKAAQRLVDLGHVVSRVETDEERLVRGGGHFPKARPATLFFGAPGPVPPRTELPPGIEPYKSAADWAAEKTAQLEADLETVLDWMSSKVRGEQRTRKQALEALDLDEDRLDAALARIVSDGVYEYRNSRYYLSDAPRKGPYRKREPKTDPTPTNIPEPGFTTEDTLGKFLVTPTVAPDPDDLTTVLRLAERLGVKLPTGNEAELRDLKRKVHGLNEINSRLDVENSKLRKQNAALRQAIIDME